ncbi:MAG: DUF4357 domain-containing protein [Bacteroidetes bacterium]|nr:DUF4357 domain-containing protein [Bacteroidota bacterium]MCW5897191.1 DUF4357 domain-containing protein [Bacteroidota bacterium]
MQTIEVDFDVFKALTSKRRSESETYNDVLRAMLDLQPSSTAPRIQKNQQGGGWVSKGIHFPVGTEFRANYKGRVYQAEAQNGGLYLDGKVHSSPSAAAIAVTGNSVNGWVFWECRFPGQTLWKSLKSIKDSGR